MLIDFTYLFKKYNIQSKGVLHVGSSTGQEAEAYFKNGVESVIWIEAIPSVFEELCGHVEKYPNTICLNACISDTDGQEVEFNISSNGGQSSSMLEFGTHKDVHPDVKFIGKIKLTTYRLDTLLRSAGVNMQLYNFLNIDLQGAELLAIRGLGMMLHGFDFLYCEVNDKHLYEGCPLVAEIDEYLERFDLIGAEAKITSFGWGDKLYIKKHLLR